MDLLSKEDKEVEEGREREEYKGEKEQNWRKWIKEKAPVQSNEE